MAQSKPAKAAVKRPKAPPPMLTPKEESDYSCQECNYLRVYHPGKSNKEIRLHCGKHRVTDEALHTDGLVNVDSRIKPEPTDEVPDELLPFVASWDGSIRTVWASSDFRPNAPASGGWEHLIEWAAEVREAKPRLTVTALVLILRQVLPGDYQAFKRLPQLFAEEYAAEKEINRRLVAGAFQVVVIKPEVKASLSITPAFRKATDVETQTPITVSPKGVREKGKDAFGYRLGTRSAAVNAFLLSRAKDWFTVAEIEHLAKATSASPHLSSLLKAGLIEVQKDGKVTKYRLKANK